MLVRNPVTSPNSPRGPRDRHRPILRNLHLHRRYIHRSQGMHGHLKRCLCTKSACIGYRCCLSQQRSLAMHLIYDHSFCLILLRIGGLASTGISSSAGRGLRRLLRRASSFLSCPSFASDFSSFTTVVPFLGTTVVPFLGTSLSSAFAAVLVPALFPGGPFLPLKARLF